LAPLAAEVEADVIELMRRRNRIAQSLGYDDYWALALALNGLAPEQVQALLAQLAHATEPAYRACLSEWASQLGVAEIRPWDLSFAQHQLAGPPDSLLPRSDSVAASLALAESLGLAEAARAVRVDYADIPFGGLCFGVRLPDDVRILAGPLAGQGDYATMFHEFGHALHARYRRAPTPILRDEPAPFNEGVACTLQRFAADAGPGLSPGAAEAHQRSWAQALLVRLRTFTGLATFEHAAYAALAQADGDPLDLGLLYRRSMQAALLIEWPAEATWADNPCWTLFPAYVQNYVVAEAIASQTHAALRRDLGSHGLRRPEAGQWLAERYWQPAGTVEWTEKVEQATGARLGVEEIVTDLKC
jgi:peptidyl-dipeptidase A